MGAITMPLLVYGSLMGIFGPVIPTVCLAYGVPVIGGGLASLLGAVELPMVVAVAYLFLGEQVSWQQWIGVIVILFGIYFSERDI
jgi:drug/metabolite transporter (DMT)-like permease